jgi:sucrose phosphorylase
MNVYTRMLRARAACPAFHPDAPQEVLETANDVFALLRQSLDGRVKVMCCFNFSAAPMPLPRGVLTAQLGEAAGFRNLLSGREMEFEDGGFSIQPYGCVWVVVGQRDRQGP